MCNALRMSELPPPVLPVKPLMYTVTPLNICGATGSGVGAVKRRGGG